MKSNLLFRLTFGLCLLPLLGGCAADGGQSTLARSWSEVLQRAGRAVAVGRAYDRGVVAARRDDTAGFIHSSEQLRRAGAGPEAIQLAGQTTLNEAERLIQIGAVYHSMSASVPAAQQQIFLRQANENYRKAQQQAPNFDSPDPIKLNALGYFLAERGDTPRDWQEAERLTRRSMQLWNEALAQMPAQHLQRSLFRFQRANTRDSLAWALFRQGRYAEARTEQEAAIQEAEHVQRTDRITSEVSPELYFHLGEIYRAMKLWTKARRQYETALKIQPADAASRAALNALNRTAPDTVSKENV